MYLDLLKVDLFLCQMRSNKGSVSFAAITMSLTHPGMYFALVCLVCSGACLSIRVDKVVRYCLWRVSGSLDGLLISSEARRSAFIFSLSILWYFRKETVALF